MHKLSTRESLFVYPVFIHKKGKLRYKHCFTFSEACRSKLCSRKVPAETQSLQAESEGRITAPHHRRYGNVQLVGGQNEPSFIHSYGGYLEANPLFMELSSNVFVTRTTPPQHNSNEVSFGQRRI
ncbi:hypothetical protein ILYODFUR_038983 [Ilyodon furcidens]|uniref:Uncharacterized protein n=1 Tax=Ilyodon furcidens TaxID=33524 RepID=A0ABV0T771_9TELE